MTSTTAKPTTAPTSTENGVDDSDGQSRVSRAAGTARQAVMDAAATARPVLADAADSAGVAAGAAVREADRLVRTSSDQTLALAGAFAMGSALGLLLGGGNRLLITASIVTTIVTAAAVMDRQERDGA